MKVRKVICVALIILLAGCNGRYQFTAVENGRQIGVLTDTVTGDIGKCWSSRDVSFCEELPSQQ